MAQQTAMQTLWNWIDSNCHEDGFNINDAREMSLRLEKEQIMNAANTLLYRGTGPGDMWAEQYYNETYNTQCNE